MEGVVAWVPGVVRVAKCQPFSANPAAVATQKAIEYLESFNGRMRDKLRNETLFVVLYQTHGKMRTGSGTTMANASIPRLAI
jgi:hypothetical protein